MCSKKVIQVQMKKTLEGFSMGGPSERPKQKSRRSVKGNGTFRSPQMNCLIGGVGRKWRAGAKDKHPLNGNWQYGLWQLCGHWAAHSGRQTHFSQLGQLDNLWLAIIPQTLVGPNSPLINQLEKSCAERSASLGFCNTHFLPLQHGCPQNRICRLCISSKKGWR